MRAYFRLLIRSTVLLVVGVFAVSFVASNSGRVSVGLYPLPYTADLPLYALSALLLLGGFLAGIMTSSFRHALRHRRLRRRLKESEIRADALQQHVTALDLEHQARRAYVPSLADPR